MPHAPTCPLHAPVVDRLTIRVIVDSAYDLFARNVSHAHVTVDQFKRTPGRQMTTLACEWGLSLQLTSERAGHTACHILDFGFTPEIINRNAHLLDIDPSRIDSLILSHAHRDHYGGMAGFIMEHRHAMPDGMTLYVGGEEAFREKWVGDEKAPISWGAVDRIMLRAHNVTPHCCPAPHPLGPAHPQHTATHQETAHGFTTGYIPRASFETVSGGSLVLPEGDASTHFTDAELAGKLVKDLHPDEHATCYILQGKGLVVITSCGHVGLINTARAAMAIAGVDKLHAVIGGFHLGPAPLDYIEHTLDELETLNPDLIIPMHCSGENFLAATRRRMPEKLVTSNVGARFVLGG